jgi:arsenate reductase-like glutaredoxin family protein
MQQSIKKYLRLLQNYEIKYVFNDILEELIAHKDLHSIKIFYNKDWPLQFDREMVLSEQYYSDIIHVFQYSINNSIKQISQHLIC